MDYSQEFFELQCLCSCNKNRSCEDKSGRIFTFYRSAEIPHFVDPHLIGTNALKELFVSRLRILFHLLQQKAEKVLCRKPCRFSQGRELWEKHFYNTKKKWLIAASRSVQPDRTLSIHVLL